MRRGDRLAALDETILRFALVQAQADVTNAQVKSADAMQERKTTLIRSGAVAQADLDTASADQKTVWARLDQAKTALKKGQDNLG